MGSMQQDDMTAQIAADLGIDHLSKEDQQTLIAQFGEVALKAATIAVVEKLPEDKRQEFAKLAEAGDAKALQGFLDTEVPDHEAVAKAAVDAEVQRFKELQASQQ